MANTWITDLKHFLNEDGTIAPMSGAGKEFAEYLCSIVVLATSYPGEDGSLLPTIYCQRRPKRRRCSGRIVATINFDSDEIIWQCPVCGDNGSIRNWEGTMWDCLDLDSLDEPYDEKIM
jgi:hypothetical protein